MKITDKEFFNTFHIFTDEDGDICLFCSDRYEKTFSACLTLKEANKVIEFLEKSIKKSEEIKNKKEKEIEEY